MSSLLSNVPNVIWFLDDICVHSSSDQQHKADLERVFGILREAGLTLNREKCTFFRESIDFLGFRVKRNQVQPLEAKVSAIREFKRPGSAKELKRFLGLTGYYRAMIPKFSVTAAPLFELLAKKNAFRWEKNQEDAFVNLKTTLANGVLRNMPDLSQPFRVRCDASGDGIGALLLQRDSDGGEKIIESRCAVCNSKISPRVNAMISNY